MKKYIMPIGLTILIILVLSAWIYYQKLKKSSEIDISKPLNIDLKKINQHDQ
jgi:hypothetical protein